MSSAWPQQQQEERSAFLLRLQPPANSTEMPSAHNLVDVTRYGATGEEQENDEGQHLLTCPTELEGSPRQGHNHHLTSKQQRARKRIASWGGAAILLALMLLAVALFRSMVTDRSNHNHDDDDDDPTASMMVHHTRYPLPRHVGPFSTLHPVDDLGLTQHVRSKDSSPYRVLTEGSSFHPANHQHNNTSNRRHFPTNRWYQSMLLVPDEPSLEHRAYSIPYVVDVVGPIAGLRVHPNHIEASTSVVQLSINEAYALTVGAAHDLSSSRQPAPKNDQETTAGPNHKYVVEQTTPLGLTLKWESFPMTSSIVNGMPYATMTYEEFSTTTINNSTGQEQTMYPTVVSMVNLAHAPIVDGDTTLDCQAPSTHATADVTVTRDIEMHFYDSDYTWLVFVSEPVHVMCVVNQGGAGVTLQFLQRTTTPGTSSNATTTIPFHIRIAVSKLCTSNNNPIQCRQEQLLEGALSIGQGRYDDVLRNHSRYFPGPNTNFDFDVNDENGKITMHFDWNVQDMLAAKSDRVNSDGIDKSTDLLVFALPHHMDLMGTQDAPGYRPYCARALTGPACLIAGSIWHVQDQIPPVSFRAARPPAPWSMGLIANSLVHDLEFTLPVFYTRGAGDTYFSGKMLAKLGRILVVAEEVLEICGRSSTTLRSTSQPLVDEQAYRDACASISLPTDEQMQNAVDTLRNSTQVWIDGTAEIPFVFDSAWGGVVSCGCTFDGKKCTNTFPHCPAFDDTGLNFGNAFYNDLHFHYGYHIYAAAVVAHFDHDWGKQFFEHTLLLVRNIANPSDDDYFPSWRHKDWYAGHSWASGIAQPVFANGRNQESSSESIAAYEAVALYGATMASIWMKDGSTEHQMVAEEIRRAGLVLTASEVRSARRYYHVEDTDSAMMPMKIYPREYTHWAIGMLWNMMGQYQTWFGAKPFLASGIQLLPITPISEQRDGVEWAKKIYPVYADSCYEDSSCVSDGWSILQLSLLATVGHPQLAAKGAVSLPLHVFESAGGNGHSLTNTLWYAATRPTIGKPLDLSELKSADATTGHAKGRVIDCQLPLSCTEYVLDTIADEYSCRQRIISLIDTMGYTELDACQTVAGIQFPTQCGPCNPDAEQNRLPEVKPTCRPCTPEECLSDLNRCPRFPQTFVCANGKNRGGCSGTPWSLDNGECSDCCELSKCPKELSVEESSCPPCDRVACRTLGRQCPPAALQPFLCTVGASQGGCSFLPWYLNNGQCDECCRILPGCDK